MVENAKIKKGLVHIPMAKIKKQRERRSSLRLVDIERVVDKIVNERRESDLLYALRQLVADVNAFALCTDSYSKGDTKRRIEIRWNSLRDAENLLNKYLQSGK
jgi:hypothetical protein